VLKNIFLRLEPRLLKISDPAYNSLVHKRESGVLDKVALEIVHIAMHKCNVFLTDLEKRLEGALSHSRMSATS